MCDIRYDDLKLEWTFFHVKIWRPYLFLSREVASQRYEYYTTFNLIIFVEEALGHRKDETILPLYHRVIKYWKFLRIEKRNFEHFRNFCRVLSTFFFLFFFFPRGGGGVNLYPFQTQFSSNL